MNDCDFWDIGINGIVLRLFRFLGYSIEGSDLNGVWRSIWVKEIEVRV